MDLLSIADQVADPTKITAKTVSALQAAVGHLSVALAPVRASSNPASSAKRKGSTRNSRPPRQGCTATEPVIVDSPVLAGALRVLQSCSAAMSIIVEKCHAAQGPLGSTWSRRRAHVVQMCTIALTVIPPVVPTEKLFSAEKKLCNIVSLAMDAQVPVDECLHLTQTLKSRVETIGVHQGWLLPSSEGSSMSLLPNPVCATPDRTLVQLASVCLLRLLHTQLASNDPDRALDQLTEAVNSDAAGHLGWWLAYLESMHGPQVSQPQYLFAARQLARAQPPSQLVSTIVDWLVRGHASPSDLQSIVNRLPTPSPLAPALAHLTRHPQMSAGSADLITIAIMWTIHPSNNSTCFTQLPSDVTSACEWLRVHAVNIPIDHPDIWTLHLAVLLIQATKAISSCVAHNGPFSPQAIKALEFLLPHLRSRTHPEKYPLARNQAMIALRAGDRFVQVARHFTDRLDPDNPFVTKDSWALALVHDCVSQMVAQLFPYLAESRTAARMLVEWLMYNAQLMAKADEMAKVERSLDTAVKVCLHGALSSASDTNADSITQSLLSCLQRIATVAATYASAARNRSDVASALGLTKVAAAALEALMSRATDHRSILAPSLASRLEIVALLAAQLGLRKESHTFMRRALALTISYGSTGNVWNMCSRYVTQSLSALAYSEGDGDEGEMPVSTSTDSLTDSATADLSSHDTEEAEQSSDGSARRDGSRQRPAKYVRLSSMVPDHWVFFFEWRALVSSGHLLLAAAVLDAWDTATHHGRLVARGHVALCKASQAGECGGLEYAEEAVELLKNASVASTNTDLPEYGTELLATAYCFLAFLRNDLAHLATAFTLFKNAKIQDRLPMISDTRWYLGKLEAVLLGHCQYHLLIQLYEVQLLLEKDSARGNVFVRLAEAYLDLGYIGQAGHCLSTGAAYLAPHERSRWNPVYIMYLLATGNSTKAATFAEEVNHSSSSTAKGHRPDGPARPKTGSETSETMLLTRMARAQLLHAQGQGPAALEAALQSLSAAAKVPSPTYQLRLLSFISRLFGELGIWSDAESHARRGLRWSTRGKNAAMQTHFASISAAVALRRRAIEDARAALTATMVGVSSGSSPQPPLRRVSSFPNASATPSRSPTRIPRPSTPSTSVSPPRPAVAQDASSNALVNKEQVARLVLLGEAALLEQASSEIQSEPTRINKLRPPSASVDEATAHELRARLLLDTLKKPRLVAELFHTSSDPSISTPRIQQVLTATANSDTTASSDKLQRMAMIALDAEVTRLRAAVLAAQGKTSDAATLLIQQVREFTAPLGFNRAQFIHDAGATILASLEPHIARIPEAAATKDSVTLHDSSMACHPVLDLDSRVVRRLKFVYDLLTDSLDMLAGTAHPGLLHGIGCMIMYVQDVARALFLPHFVDSSWPVHQVADLTCHGVTLKRMVTLFGPKHGGGGLSGKEKRMSTVSTSSSRRPRTSTRSTQGPTAKCGPAADNVFLKTPPPKPSRPHPDTAIATPTPTTPTRRSRRSRPTPRTNGPLEEEMLCLMLDESGGDPEPSLQASTLGSAQLSDLLPATWTVSQLSIDPLRNILTLIVRTRTDHLTLRLPLGRRELIHRMPKDKFAAATYANVRSMLDAIVHESDSMLRGTYETRDDKLKWWDTRERLNRELEAIVARLDGGWLGCFRKVLVAGEQPSRGEFLRRLNDYLAPHRKGPQAPQDLELPALVVNGWLALGRTVTDVDVEDVTYFVLGECLRQGYPVATAGRAANVPDGSITFDSLMWFLAKTFKSLLSKSTTESIVVQDHAVLILDKHAHPFPWESTGSLAGKSVSRVFSLTMLTELLVAQRKRMVSKASVYYCINPGGDLTATQDRFEDIVRANSSWRGMTGSAPSQAQFLSHVSNSDIYVFIGHNGGEQLCPPKRILSHHSGPAVALLLGCSSGKLSAPGEFDPIGTPMYYAPHSLCVVGNLWDVTDRDIDRFTVAMLASWGLISRDSVLPAGDVAVPNSEKKGIAGQELARNMAADASLMQDRVLSSKLGRGRRADAVSSMSESASTHANASGQVDLSTAVAQARSVCKLRYLNGAAPVVYGIPVQLTE